MAEKDGPKGTRPEKIKQKSSESDSATAVHATAAPETPSIADRVKSSASGLLRNTISPSTAASHSFGSDLSNTLSAKPSASSSSSSLSSSSSHTALDNRLRSSTSRSFSSSTGGGESTGSVHESFRSSWTSTSEADNREKAWEQNFTDPATSTFEQHDLSQSKGKGRLVEVNDYAPSQSPVFQQHNETSNTIFDSAWLDSNASQESAATLLPEELFKEQQQQQDGSEVSALLSDPSFQPLYDYDTDDDDQIPGYKIQPIPRDPLFHNTHERTSIPKILDSAALVPDVEASNKSIVDAMSDEELKGVLRELGLLDWVDLDDRYQDEVWGDLEPYAKAAKAEVEEKKVAGDNNVADGPAVMRLRMVLGHFKDKGASMGG